MCVHVQFNVGYLDKVPVGFWGWVLRVFSGDREVSELGKLLGKLKGGYLSHVWLDDTCGVLAEIWSMGPNWRSSYAEKFPELTEDQHLQLIQSLTGAGLLKVYWFPKLKETHVK